MNSNHDPLKDFWQTEIPTGFQLHYEIKESFLSQKKNVKRRGKSTRSHRHNNSWIYFAWLQRFDGARTFGRNRFHSVPFDLRAIKFWAAAAAAAGRRRRRRRPCAGRCGRWRATPAPRGRRRRPRRRGRDGAASAAARRRPRAARSRRSDGTRWPATGRASAGRCWRSAPALRRPRVFHRPKSKNNNNNNNNKITSRKTDAMTTRRSTRHRQTTVEVLVFLDGVLDLTRKDGQHVGLHGGERAIGTLAVADALRIQVEDVAGQQRPFSIAQHTKKNKIKTFSSSFGHTFY